MPNRHHHDLVLSKLRGVWLTTANIAQAVGTTPAAAHRILEELRDAGRIESRSVVGHVEWGLVSEAVAPS